MRNIILYYCLLFSRRLAQRWTAQHYSAAAARGSRQVCATDDPPIHDAARDHVHRPRRRHRRRHVFGRLLHPRRFVHVRPQRLPNHLQAECKKKQSALLFPLLKILTFYFRGGFVITFHKDDFYKNILAKKVVFFKNIVDNWLAVFISFPLKLGSW